jgi:hypothetical protein
MECASYIKEGPHGIHFEKKCEKKIIYIKYRNASSNVIELKVKFRNNIFKKNIHFSLLEGLECDRCLNLINFSRIMG